MMLGEMDYEDLCVFILNIKLYFINFIISKQ